jgi:hypothetical protein
MSDWEMCELIARRQRELNAFTMRYVLGNSAHLEGDERDNDTPHVTAGGYPLTDPDAIEAYWEELRAGMPEAAALDRAGHIERAARRQRHNADIVVTAYGDDPFIEQPRERRRNRDRAGCVCKAPRCYCRRLGSAGKPMCGSSHCYCGNSRTQCEWWKARNAKELATTTDPAVIAQQLWAESRALLAKVNVELPASPPAPVKPMRWYRRPNVKRYLFFGTLPALVMLAAFSALSGEVVWTGPVCAFLWGAFVTYETTVRTDARGVVVGTRLRARHIVARIVAIAALGILLATWVA